MHFISTNRSRALSVTFTRSSAPFLRPWNSGPPVCHGWIPRMRFVTFARYRGAAGAGREGKEEEDEEEIKQKTWVEGALGRGLGSTATVEEQEELRETYRSRASFGPWTKARRKGAPSRAPCPQRLISGSPESSPQRIVPFLYAPRLNVRNTGALERDARAIGSRTSSRAFLNHCAARFSRVTGPIA